MQRIDRALLAVLALGVWALVLSPDLVSSAIGITHDHECTAIGTAYGEMTGLRDVYVDDFDLTVRCIHR